MATVTVEIATAKVRLKNEHYTDWVKSKEFFDVVHYPAIHFESDPFPYRPLREGAQITGKLRMRGAARRVRFDIEPNSCAIERNEPCRLRARSAVKRSAFGMKTRLGTVSDRVDLDFEIAARPE